MISNFRYFVCLFSLLSAYMHTSGLTGRVLDEARLLPVEGAVVTHVGGAEQDTTDDEGRFTLLTGSPVDPSHRVFPVMYVRGDVLFFYLQRESRLSLEIFSITGSRISGWEPRVFEPGNHQVDLEGLFTGKAGTSVGYVRVRTGGMTSVFRVTRLTRNDGDEIRVTPGLKKIPGKTPASAGQIGITRELLMDLMVDFITEDEDLGDIILHYPPRETGVGAEPIYGSEHLFDGTRASLDANWQMWQSPWRIDNGLPATPVTWEMVDDPVDDGQVVSTINTHDSKWYGREEIVTKKNYRDFQVHVEFNVSPGANSGVYLQNRYEIQVTDGGGVGHLYAEVNRTSNEYAGANQWNAYDITFRAARWNGDARTKMAMLTMWWNGVKVHENIEADETHGMDFNGEEDQFFVPGGELVDPTDQGLKFQNHGAIVRYRNVWVLELDIAEEDTDFGY